MKGLNQRSQLFQRGKPKHAVEKSALKNGTQFLVGIWGQKDILAHQQCLENPKTMKKVSGRKQRERSQQGQAQDT